MRTRLYHARILTMEENCEIFPGEIWIRDDRIENVISESVSGEKNEEDEAAAGEMQKFDLEIDCEYNLLMPGFKNCHTHSPMTFLRSFADDLPLQEWLNTKVFPNEEKLTREDMYWFAKLAILEYLSGGITTICDMYLQPTETARACVDLGMRAVLVSGLNNFTSSIEQAEAEYLEWNNKHPLIRYFLGCHAEYTCDLALLQQLSRLTHKYQAPLYLHLSETEKEIRECVARYGKTPTAFLDSLGLFDYGGIGAHCIYLSDEDLEIFQKKKICAVTNPASNLKLASGIAPIARLRELGIPVAIGTDGAASNNCLDMFREMFLVTGLSKLREQKAEVTKGEEVLRMATVEGSKVLRLPETATLSKGMLADLIMLDLQKPNMRPIHNIQNSIVYSGSKDNVKMTMIGGKILYQDGKYFVGESPMQIYEECDKRVKGLF